MKSKITKILTAIICLPIMLLCACSSKKSDLKAINLPTYYSNTVATSIYEKSNSTSIELADLIAKEPNLTILNQYTSFTLKSNAVWTYKLYIDYIYFYVYTNKATDNSLTVNISITNLANENDIENPSNDFVADCSMIPQKDGSFLCEVKVQKVVATATGTTLTFDILQSTEVFTDAYGNDNGFKWIIYGLEFYAESRTYSK